MERAPAEAHPPRRRHESPYERVRDRRSQRQQQSEHTWRHDVLDVPAARHQLAIGHAVQLALGERERCAALEHSRDDLDLLVVAAPVKVRDPERGGDAREATVGAERDRRGDVHHASDGTTVHGGKEVVQVWHELQLELDRSVLFHSHDREMFGKIVSGALCRRAQRKPRAQQALRVSEIDGRDEQKAADTFNGEHGGRDQYGSRRQCYTERDVLREKPKGTCPPHGDAGIDTPLPGCFVRREGEGDLSVISGTLLSALETAGSCERRRVGGAVMPIHRESRTRITISPISQRKADLSGGRRPTADGGDGEARRPRATQLPLRLPGQGG